MGTAIMVTSGKGGTGKTSFTAGVGGCLAGLGKRVLCMDLDIGLRGLDLILGMSDRAVMDFSDVMEGRCPLEDAAAGHPEIPGLYLLTAPIRPESLDFDRFRQIVDQAKEAYDFVLLDSPAGLGEGFRLAAVGADTVVVVTTADPPAQRNAQRCVAELIHTAPQLLLVMNRVQPGTLRRLHGEIDRAMDATGLPLLGVVPEDAQVGTAARAGRPLVLHSYKGAARAYLNIARRLLGRRVPIGEK